MPRATLEVVVVEGEEQRSERLSGSWGLEDRQDRAPGTTGQAEDEEEEEDERRDLNV